MTHADLGKLNSDNVEQASLIRVWSLEAFFRHFIFHLYSAHYATLVPDWAGSLSSSSAAGTNGCLDLSCCSCPPSVDKSFSYTRCSGS